MDVIEQVIKGRDGEIKLGFFHADGRPVNLASVNKVALEFVGKYSSIDSDTYPEAFEWLNERNVLTLRLGNLDLPLGLYPVRIFLFDHRWSNGLPVVTESSNPRLLLKITPSFNL